MIITINIIMIIITINIKMIIIMNDPQQIAHSPDRLTVPIKQNLVLFFCLIK
jgi:hypothetical protein